MPHAFVVDECAPSLADAAGDKQRAIVDFGYDLPSNLRV
jgi:hypothetical protein